MSTVLHFLLASLLVTMSSTSFSNPPTDDELAKKYKKEYKDDQFISTETTTDIAFAYDKKSAQPFITNKERIKLISLRDYASLVYHVSYDDNSEIAPDYIARDSKKKTIYGVDKVCQNYLVSGIFYSDSKICSYKVPLGAFASTNEFGVDVKYKDVKYFTKVLFHETFPVENRTITFLIPDWMDVELMEMNFNGFDIKKTKEVDAKLKATRYTYKVSKLKGFDNESYTQGVCHRYPHILVLSKSYTANNQKKEILKTSADLYKWYYGLVKSVDNQSDLLKEQVNKLIAGKTTDDEKIKAVYYWVQDNIRYIAFEQGIAGYKPEAAYNVYKNKYGDCKGMANLSKEMLKLAGYDARLTWIGTTNLPYSCQIPSLAINDHMICTVILNNKKYILDPTEKFVALGDHAERIQGKDIMIENGESFIQDKVPVHGKERNLTTIVSTLEVDGTSLKGTAQMVLKGEEKKTLLYQIDMTSAKDKDKLFKYLTSKGGDKNLKVEVTKTTSSTERESDMKIDYTFKIDNYISTFDKEMYIDLDPYKQYKWMVIDSTREYDVAFGEKVFIKDVYKLKIPQGYKVKSLPKGMDSKQENFSAKLSYTEKNGEVIVEKEISVDNGIIKKSDFTAWNAMIKELAQNYNDHLILTKP